MNLAPKSRTNTVFFIMACGMAAVCQNGYLNFETHARINFAVRHGSSVQPHGTR